MKKFTKIICVLMLSFTMLLLLGCESIKGPQGRYIYRQDKNLVYSITFEDDLVNIKYKGEDKGSFEYEYKKSETESERGTVTIDSDAFPWVMEFNYEIKELRCDIDGDGQLNVFTKVE